MQTISKQIYEDFPFTLQFFRSHYGGKETRFPITNYPEVPRNVYGRQPAHFTDNSFNSLFFSVVLPPASKTADIANINTAPIRSRTKSDSDLYCDILIIRFHYQNSVFSVIHVTSFCYFHILYSLISLLISHDL